MRRTAASAFIFGVLGPFLGLLPDRAAACSVVSDRQPRPIRCAPSVALRIEVDGAAVFDGDRAKQDSFERYLRAGAIRALGENRIAIDPQAPELLFAVRPASARGLKIVVESRGPESSKSVDRGSEALEKAEVEAAEELAPDSALETLPVEMAEHPGDLARVALDLFSRTVANNWQLDCEPRRTLSASGRFAFDLPPIQKDARDRYLAALAEEGAPTAGLTGSLVERFDDGETMRVSTFQLADERLPDRFLVSDDGRFVVAFDLREGRGSSEGRTRIYRSDGSLVSTLTLADLLTRGDLNAHRMVLVTSTCGGETSPLSATLADGRDLLILTLDASKIPHEIVVDLETGKLLTARRNLLPQLGVSTVALDGSPSTAEPRSGWVEAVCSRPLEAAAVSRTFADPSLLGVTASSLFSHAMSHEMPAYTDLGRRARLEGTVEVEVVVGESGEVSCVRVSKLPLGLDKAAAAAATKWRFRPFDVDGKPARAIGRFSFRFGWIDPAPL